MIPLLAIAGARVGATVIQNLAENIGHKKNAEQVGAAQQGQFAEMLARASASPQVQQARFLHSEGIQDRADAATRLGDLAQQIAQAPEIRDITAGSTGAFDLKVNADGNVEVRTADGRVRTVALNGEQKTAALKAHQIIEATAGPAPLGNAPQGVMHVTPGGGVSVRL
jgi:hypothetical protein